MIQAKFAYLFDSFWVSGRKAGRIFYIYFVFVVSAVVVPVIVPCNVEGAQIGVTQEWLEHDLCFFMSGKNRLRKDVQGGFFSVLFRSSQCINYIYESRPKSSGGFVELTNSDNFVVSGDSKSVVNLGFQEVAQNSSESTPRKEQDRFREYFKKILHEDIPLIFILGLTWSAGFATAGFICLLSIDSHNGA
jgi:hypothetical protein